MQPIRITRFLDHPNAQGDVSNIFEVIGRTPHISQWFSQQQVDIEGIRTRMNQAAVQDPRSEASDFCWNNAKSVFHELMQTLSILDTHNIDHRTDPSASLDVKAEQLKQIHKYMQENDMSSWSIYNFYNEWLPNEREGQSSHSGANESQEYW